MQQTQRVCLPVVWLPRIFALLVCGALFVVEPPAWAASVPALPNQTVPPPTFDLYLPRLVTTFRLTTLSDHPSDEYWPAWSFDGAHAGFIRVEGDWHQIRRVNADGSNPLLLLDEQGEYAAGFVWQAVWSPDGSRIAYIRAEGIHDLYVMQADGSAKHRIVAGKPNLTDLVWSPDGRSIAFENNGAIYTVAPDGSNLKMIAGEETMHLLPVWSPDSSQIAYADTSVNAILIQNVATGAVRQLTNSVGVAWAYSRFRWSPDGKMMAFVYSVPEDNGQLEIGVVDIASGVLTRVTNHFAEEHDLAWSPDSRQLTFARSADIHVINVDGSDHRILTQGFGEESLPAWSPDGSKIAFVSDHANRHAAYMIDAGGGTPTRITNDINIEQSVAWSPSGDSLLIGGYRAGYRGLRLISAEGGASVMPLPEIPIWRFAWSPATPQIAFRAERSPDLMELYRADADGDNLTKLSAALSVDYFAWSPDGQRLLFTVLSQDVADLYVVDASGAHLTKLTTIPAPQWRYPPLNPVWSPDSTRVAFANGDIYLLEVANGSLRNLPNTRVQGGEPVWSPSGELLAYFGASLDIFVVNPGSGERTQLTDDRAEEISPPLTWSPDGRKIAYVNGQIEPGCDPRGGCNPINSLSIVDVDGSNHKIVEGNAYPPIWSPDSRHLLYYSNTGTVALVDAEGNNRLELAARQDGYFDISSPWSPDSKRILLGIDGDIYIFHLPNLP